MQRSTYTLAFLLFIVSALVSESCVDHDLDKIDPCEELPQFSYQTDVKPIVETRCAITGCHNGDNGATKNWTDFGIFQSKALSGLVSEKIRSRTMPPKVDDLGRPVTPLTEDQINIIACWAENGALNN